MQTQARYANLYSMSYIKDEEPARIFFLLAVVFIFYNFILHPLGFLQTSALHTNDFFSSLSRAGKKLPREIKDILVVAIDNASLKEAGLQWPWKRSTFAELVGKISSCQPKAIFLDFTFLGKSSDESLDLQLAEVIKNAGNVVLAGYIDEEGEFVRPLDIFSTPAKAIGLVNKKAAKHDIRVRSMRAVFRTKNKSLQAPEYDFSAEIKILALLKDIPLESIRYDSNQGRVILSPQLTFQVDNFGLIPINYSAGVSDFINLPVYKFLGSQPIEPDLLKDKIVMVGITADIAHDIHPTPLGSIPGIYINANSLLMLLSGNLLKTLPYWLGIGIFLFFSLAGGFLSYRLKPAYSILLLPSLLSFISLGYIFLQARYNFRMDIFSLIFLSAVSYAAVEIYKYTSLVIESEKLKIQAIIDPLTELYTQRYFQLKVQSVLQKQAKAAEHFFCLLYLNEFSQLSERHTLALPHLIKMVSQTIKECAGKKSLLARYGEEAFSLCVFHIKLGEFENSLCLLAERLARREFVINKEIIKISVKIAAVGFPREHIKNYPDLVLTCEAVLKRIAPDAKAPLAIFDPEVDRIIAASESILTAGTMPRGELGYVSMDLQARNKELESALEELKSKQKEIARNYFYAMHSLVKALEEKDLYTAGHSERVSFYATALAEGLHLPNDEIEVVNRAAYLHDIGKIGLPDRILQKKERLNDEEFEFVKRHQAQGAKILEGLPFFEEVIPLVLYHHERYDGKGYPHGLTGDMIPRGAQIIAIADSFDAMTTGRGYNSPLLSEEAVGELRKCSGEQFNPAYVKTFIELVQQKKIRPRINIPV